MSDAHTYFFRRDSALSEALRLLLVEAQPPRWRLDLRWRLQRRKEWACTCASYGWPQWYYEAVNCGADPEQLTAMHMLIFGYAPMKLYKRPYMGM